MTHFLRDILRQPSELQRTLEHLSGAGRSALDPAVAAVRAARHVYLTGIGSSWHAGLNVSTLFQLAAKPVYLVDAAELVQFAAIPAGSVLPAQLVAERLARLSGSDLDTLKLCSFVVEDESGLL